MVERSCTVWRIKRTHKCARAHTEKERDRHTHRHTVHSYLRSCSIQKSQGPQHVPRDPRGCSLEAALVVDCVAFRGARACPWDCSLLTATSFCRRRAASLWFFIPGVPHLPPVPRTMERERGRGGGYRAEARGKGRRRGRDRPVGEGGSPGGWLAPGFEAGPQGPAPHQQTRRKRCWEAGCCSLRLPRHMHFSPPTNHSSLDLSSLPSSYSVFLPLFCSQAFVYLSLPPPPFSLFHPFLSFTVTSLFFTCFVINLFCSVFLFIPFFLPFNILSLFCW